ncbi:GxGYxYP family putative glycoside hydrolase [Anaerolineales bacterium HSG6]|nr:GxGYxYP family putative glycoside hydrolase [Anaerolineales bacterium HSG6]
MHINHYEFCHALTDGEENRCPADSPPPAGKTFDDLIYDYDLLNALTTLQGIVNRDQPRLYLNQDHARDGQLGVDMFWLEIYQQQNQPYGWLADTEIIELESVEALLEEFAPLTKGIVLWDTDVPATLNVATTIAGVEDLVVLRNDSPVLPLFEKYLTVEKSLVGLFRSNATTLPDSNTPSSGSTKIDAHLWAMENYLETGLANPLVMGFLGDGWPIVRYQNQQMTRGGVYAFERDYVVQERGFAFDLSPWPDEVPIDDPHQSLGLDADTLKQIAVSAKSQANGQLIKIWGFHPWYEKYAGPDFDGGDPDSEKHPIMGEWVYLWFFSQHGGYMEGGGGDVNGLSMSNISVHRFAPPPAPRTPSPLPTEAELMEKGYLNADGTVSDDYTFLMFYVGDYDIVHPAHTLLANYPPAPWQDEKRGQIPLAWGLNPGMVEEIPGMMSYWFATATDNDFIVGTNSGAGYINPDGPDKLTFLRWLWRTNYYYKRYGYDIFGFIINGDGAHMSQRRLDAFSYITPVGMLTIDIQTDDPWPRYQNGAPLSVIPINAFGGTPDSSAHLVHEIYQRDILAPNRPPFLVFRSTFLSASFLWEIRERLKVHEDEGIIMTEDGRVLQPNYTVVDPYTFFALLDRQLAEDETNAQ